MYPSKYDESFLNTYDSTSCWSVMLGRQLLTSGTLLHSLYKYSRKINCACEEFGSEQSQISGNECIVSFFIRRILPFWVSSTYISITFHYDISSIIANFLEFKQWRCSETFQEICYALWISNDKHKLGSILEVLKILQTQSYGRMKQLIKLERSILSKHSFV